MSYTGSKAVAIELAGAAPLVMEVHRLRFERTEGGRFAEVARPADPMAIAADYLDVDGDGRPCIGWEWLLWRVAGRPGPKAWESDADSTWRGWGLAIDGARLVVDGDWRPRRFIRRGLDGPMTRWLPEFREWTARGVLLYVPDLWSEHDVRSAVECSGEGMYRLASWGPAAREEAARASG